MDAIIQTLTLAIVLLIVGLACVVLGIAGLVWMSGRSRKRRDGQIPASTADESVAATSARPRHGDGRTRDGAAHLPGHP